MSEKNLNFNIQILTDYLFFLFDNVLNYYDKLPAFSLEKTFEKTKYRIKNNMERLKMILKSGEHFHLIFFFQKKVIFFKGLIEKNEKEELDIFEKTKKDIIFNILIKYCVALEKEIRNSFLFETKINFLLLEQPFLTELNILYFEYKLFAKKINPKVDIKIRNFTKIKKKTRKKRNLIFKENLINMSRLLIFLFFILMVFIFIIFSFFSNLFFKIFFHKKMDTELFFENYNKKIEELFWYESLQIHLKEFFLYFSFEFDFNFFFCILLLFFFIFFTNKIKRKSEKVEKNMQEVNFCLEKNLIAYHRVMFSFINISKKKEKITADFLKNIRRIFVFNFENLHFIVTRKKKQVLLKIIKQRLKFLESYEKETEDLFEKQVYFEEKKHCEMLFIILEENNKIKKLIFIEKMLAIVEHISNKLEQEKLKENNKENGRDYK